MENNKKYCTYVKYYGLFGFLNGWFLVGLSATPHFGGYANEFMASHDNFQMILIETEAPLKPSFMFNLPFLRPGKIVSQLIFNKRNISNV